jgi:hypothetical protein
MPSGSGPPPEHIQVFLREPRPAIIGSLLANGSPSTVVTWYLWLGGDRLLLSTQTGGFRERNLARDGRVALTVLGEDWYDHVSLRGRVVEMRADPNWVDLDALTALLGRAISARCRLPPVDCDRGGRYVVRVPFAGPRYGSGDPVDGRAEVTGGRSVKVGRSA